MSIESDKPKERKYKPLRLVTGHHLAPINPPEVERALEVLTRTKVIAHMPITSTFTSSHTLIYSCGQMAPGTIHFCSMVILYLARIRISSLVLGGIQGSKLGTSVSAASLEVRCGHPLKIWLMA